jgi:uncharacterized protein (UPF0297 family)
MAIKRIVKWYFGEEDKAEVKKYSKKISTIFKIEGYNPEYDEFVDFFEIEDFFFIPCIKEGYEETEEEAYDEFMEEAIKALNSAYDSSVKVSLDDLEEYARNSIKIATVRDLLIDWIDRKDIVSDNFVDFIDSCGLEVKQKFVSWLFNNNH